MQLINQRALMVRLEDLAAEARLPAGVFAERDQRGVVLRAVNCGLAQTKQVQIRAVDDE